MATLYDPLQSKADTLSSGLQSSSTAYAPNTLPTTRDISEDNQLTSVNKQIEDEVRRNLERNKTKIIDPYLEALNVKYCL